MHIRRGRLDDVDPVRDLLAETWTATYGPLLGRDRASSMHAKWHASEVLAKQVGAEHTSFLVAEDEASGIVAHAFGAFGSAQRPPVLFVVRLYVRPAYQRRGFGTRLLADLVARHPGAGLVRLYAVEGNDAAIRFYRGQGFAIVGEAEEEGIRSLRMERAIV